MSTARSDTMFRIASEHGIPLQPGASEPILDSTFEAFRERYLGWSSARDQDLGRYLQQSPSLFRVYLPYSERVFQIASQVAWYLDEIIIRDPVVIALNPKLSIEQQKQQVVRNFQFLSHFRPLIEDGFLLLGGPSHISEAPDEGDIPESFDRFLEIPEVSSALREAAYCGFETQKDSAGNLVDLYEIRLDSGGVYGFKFSNLGPKQQVTSPVIDLWTRLPQLSVQELLKRLDKIDPFEQCSGIFRREVYRTIRAAEVAQELGSAVLFDRTVDEVILSHCGGMVDRARQTAAVGTFNLTLPFVRGVPADRLIELRTNLPDAFIDFRGKMLSVVQEAIREGIDDQAAIKQRVERELVPDVRSLESEVNSALRRARILSAGLPLISAFGVLSGGLLSVPPAAVLAGIFAGLAGGLKAMADGEAAREKVKGHPLYFLWQARRETK